MIVQAKSNIRAETVADHGDFILLKACSFHQEVYHIMIRFTQNIQRADPGCGFNKFNHGAAIRYEFTIFDRAAYIRMRRDIRYAFVNQTASR
ncbi:hypothetical protein SDC9_138769 [bioreactor metagenome]|uniref:Uncharacterized protein n=1 Tax=bioreactor metagenome TaxID=1076179 RepID=A0A645DR78_9ZZZZ